MSHWQCNSCDGAYTDTCADGLAYYHKCSPITSTKDLSTTPRPGARDENVAPKDNDNPVVILAEGLGRVVADASALNPQPAPATPGLLARVLTAIRK